MYHVQRKKRVKIDMLRKRVSFRLLVIIGFNAVNYFHKTPLLDVLQGSKYTSENEYIWFKLSCIRIKKID